MLKRPALRKNQLIARSLRPNYIADSVADIDWNYLQSQGIKAALIDLDGTVVARGTYEVSDVTQRVLATQPLKIYIATNRPKSRDLKELRQHLNANGVIHPTGIWGKPFRKYFLQAGKDHGLQPSEIVMIGDRYLQDVFGANSAGIQTIVVRKLDKPTNFFDRFISWLERTRTDQLAKHYQQITK